MVSSESSLPLHLLPRLGWGSSAYRVQISLSELLHMLCVPNLKLLCLFGCKATRKIFLKHLLKYKLRNALSNLLWPCSCECLWLNPTLGYARNMNHHPNHGSQNGHSCSVLSELTSVRKGSGCVLSAFITILDNTLALLENHVCVILRWKYLWRDCHEARWNAGYTIPWDVRPMKSLAL